MTTYRIRVNGRPFRITPLEQFRSCDDWWMPVDCRDTLSRMESQAIINAQAAQSLDTILAEREVQDAIRSAYYNGTSHESGRYPAGGTHLPRGNLTEVAPDMRRSFEFRGDQAARQEELLKGTRWEDVAEDGSCNTLMGGLISFTVIRADGDTIPEDKLIVSVYRTDPNVEVRLRTVQRS